MESRSILTNMGKDLWTHPIENSRQRCRTAKNKNDQTREPENDRSKNNNKGNKAASFYTWFPFYLFCLNNQNAIKGKIKNQTQSGLNTTMSWVFPRSLSHRVAFNRLSTRSQTDLQY